MYFAAGNTVHGRFTVFFLFVTRSVCVRVFSRSYLYIRKGPATFVSVHFHNFMPNVFF